ncbi:MAG: M18 family aminopeptidase [Mogibacterium sp.]|nr:M18 family aminopeptidase [Mogibacterium sp.]
MTGNLNTTEIRNLLDFIGRSPTAFHAAANLREMLLEAGFTALSERDIWNLVPGGRYVVTRNDSSIIAFTLPTEPVRSLRIAAAHTDSPCFRIKGLEPEIAVDGKYLKLNTEVYGGALYTPWLDRPLTVAGRVVYRSGDELVSKLIHIDRDLLVIPNVALHFNHNANKSVELNPQIDLLPLFAELPEDGGDGESKAASFRRMIAEEAGTDQGDLLAADLFVCCRQAGCIWGANNEFFSAPRIDNLECAYALCQGFLNAAAKPSEEAGTLAVYACFDSEETGSRSMQGADSSFTVDVMARIREALGLTAEQYLAAVANGFLISADNAHAVHPNHPEVSDPKAHPAMNRGPVLKYTASPKYTTTAVSGAKFRDLCDRCGVPVQEFYNRADSPGGSTLGSHFTTHLSLPSADIGLAQLAMHSAYETAGTRDLEMLIRVMERYYR